MGEARKLLIVDDQAIFRLQFKQAAAAGNAFEVVDAEDGALGYERFVADPDIAFMVVDVHMPNLDGPGMLRKLAAEHPDRLAAVRIFMVTTEADPKLREEGKQLGVASWLVKPVDPAKFLGWLNKKFPHEVQHAAS